MYFPSNLKSYSFLAILYLSSLYLFVFLSYVNMLLSAIQGSIVAIKKLFIDRINEDDKHLLIDIQEVGFMLIVFALTSIRAQTLYRYILDIRVCVCQLGMTSSLHSDYWLFPKIASLSRILLKMLIGTLTLKLLNP